MAAKTVRVRLNRTMKPIDGEKRFAGYETTLPVTLAEQWARNGRISILAPKVKAGAADPTKAPPSGSPAGQGAASSSSRPARPPRKPRST
jgi:hypothetical protein